MRNSVALLLLAILAGAAGCRETEERARPRVLLLAIEGADPDLIQGSVESGDLPGFGRIAREGCVGKTLAPEPLLSPVVWTTLATGRDPEDHLVDFPSVADPVSGELLPVTGLLRRTEAIWDILGRRGFEVGVTGWPGTWPAEPLNGFVLTDRWQPGPALPPESVHPPDLAERIADCPDATTAALRLWTEERPDFLAVCDRRLAFVSHAHMVHAAPKKPVVSRAAFAEHSRKVGEAYLAADALVVRALAAVGPDGTLIVVSGFGFRHGIQRPRKPVSPDHRDAVGWHRRTGYLGMIGPGIRRGALESNADIRDLVPTILAILGLPDAADLPGRPPRPALSLPVPAESIETYEAGRRERVLRQLCPEDPPEIPSLDAMPALEYIGAALTVQDPENRARLYLARGKVLDARRNVVDALGLRPESPIAHFLSGEVRQRFRLFEKAALAFSQASRLDPEMLVARFRLARSLKRRGRARDAVQVARDAVARAPWSAPARLLLSQYLLTTGERDAAERQLRRALLIEPELVLARNQLGLLLLARGEIEGAEAEFLRATRSDRAFVPAWNNLSVVQLQRSLDDEDPVGARAARDRARATLAHLIEEFPDYSRAYYNRARLFMVAGERDSARRDLEKALELEPGYEAARKLIDQL